MDEKTFKARTKKLAVAIIKQMEALPKSRTADIYKETDEILAMTVASIKTLRNRKS